MLCTKKMRSLIVILALFFLIGLISACSNEHTTLKLSEMDEDLFIQYLADYRVEIPDNLEVTVVQDIIAGLEVEPDKTAPIVGWSEFADFFEELRYVVKEYNNLTPGKSIETNNKLTSVNQATNYSRVAMGKTIAGQRINGIVFYFSSKPPQAIIDALKRVNVSVDWAR